MKPLVSVVMPVWHSNPDKLERAIGSILVQTYPNLELIIVADEATPEEYAVIMACAAMDSRIKCYFNKPRQGLVRSLNSGFALAQGKYIARMDADDISYPDRLRKQVDFMESHPEVGICGCSHILKREGKTMVSHYQTEDANIRCTLMFDTAFSHPCTIFRKSFIETIEGPYCEDFTFAEDYELWVRCAGKTILANIEDILLEVENDGTNICDTNHEELIKQTIRIREIAARKFGFPYQEKSSDLGRMRWLEKVYATNEMLNKFPREYLNKRIGEDWYNYCLEYTKFGLNAWRIFWSSPLSECIHLNPIRKLKFFVACLIKWRV